MTTFISSSHAVYSNVYHIVLVTKYRKSILTGELNNDLLEIFKMISEYSRFEVLLVNSDKDHVHLLVSIPPKYSVSQVVRRLKQSSTTLLYDKHETLLRKYYWYQNILWSNGYACNTLGEVSIRVVEEYIENQGMPKRKVSR